MFSAHHGHRGTAGGGGGGGGETLVHQQQHQHQVSPTASAAATTTTTTTATAATSPTNDLKHPNTDSDNHVIRRPSMKKKKISNGPHGQDMNRAFSGGMLSLAGSMPPAVSTMPSSTTPFSHPAAFPWAQQQHLAGPLGSSVGDGAITSLATSRLTSTTEAPDYFAQHLAQTPAATSTSDITSHPPPMSAHQHESDPFNNIQPPRLATNNSFQIPSGPVMGPSTGAASRFTLPAPHGGKGVPSFGGISMSARSSRQSTAPSAHSVAASTNSANSVATSASGTPTGLPEELARFRPVEADVLASLLSGSSSSESLAESSSARSVSSSSMDATSIISSTSTSSSSSSLSAAEKVLIIDIRPSASYSSARIRTSINVCAPSTLLKRPGITVDQVEDEMLGSEGDRRRFKLWRLGPRRIRPKSTDVGHSAMSLSRSNSRSKKTAQNPQSPHQSTPASSSPTPPSNRSHATSATNNSSQVSSPISDPQGTEEMTLVPGSTNGITKIIVLDTDTTRVATAGKPAMGGGASCLVGMLRKFEAAGFAGELGWLVGGFNRFAGCKGANEAGLIERGPLTNSEGDDESSTASGDGGAQQQQGDADRRLAPFKNDLASRRSSAPNAGKLFLGGMSNSSSHDRQTSGNGSDMAAQSDGNNRRLLVQPRGLPLSAFNTSTTTSNATGGKGGFGTAQTRNSASACANPFFDNIRQNRELANGVTDRVPMTLPSLSSTQLSALPVFLQNLAAKSEKDRAEKLAQGFFSIEQAEQKRLMGTMHQHAAECGTDPRQLMGHDGSPTPGGQSSMNDSLRKAAQLSSSLAGIGAGEDAHPSTTGIHTSWKDQPTSPVFPFSIAAALERGADNRYDNIWTYEHSRVQLSRLRSLTDPNSNYINASFIQPAREFGCTRMYIATQAPLPTTFEHFWTMCWEQNVRVVVMVTREHEAGRIQAHRYWDDTCYGRDMRLRQIREQCFDSTGVEVNDAEAANRLASNANDEAGGGMFPTMPQPAAAVKTGEPGRPVLIRRTFALSNAAEPEEGERTLTQLQYVAWPDYTVPESPESLLRLLDVADAAQFEAEKELSPSAAQGQTQPSNLFSHAFHGGSVSKAATKRAVGPMLVHCSAGVGRTGTFIAVDSGLDAIRRQRAKAKGESLDGVWDNGKAARVGGQSGQVTAAFAPEHQMSTVTPPATSSSSSSTTTKRQVSKSQAQPAPVTPPRTLKREHSMDLDDIPPGNLKANIAPFQFSFDPSGHRPRSRSRSIEPSGSDGENENAYGAAHLATSGTSSPEPQPGWAAPSPLPTPLRHLDSMCLTSTSASPRGTPLLPQDEGSPMMLGPTPQAAALSPLANAAPTVKAAEGGEDDNVKQADIVQKIVEVMREQRMSSVQTTRQFVFVYSAG
ncbi:hypothetical protein CF335_g7295 [Tilletia laevis]|nr:hypothetical protein CF335_g7295 [Tilletia laevis]